MGQRVISNLGSKSRKNTKAAFRANSATRLQLIIVTSKIKISSYSKQDFIRFLFIPREFITSPMFVISDAMTTENEKPPNEEVKPGKFSTEAVTELIKVSYLPENIIL